MKSIWLVATLCWFSMAGCRTTDSGPVYLVRVQSGDTLVAIANKYDTTWDKIAELNNIPHAKGLHLGQVLRVRPGPGGLVAGARVVDPRSYGIEQPSDEASSEPGRKGLLFDGADAKVIWPLQGKISSNFGMRWGKRHEGIDIKAARGTRFAAAATGRVVFVGRKSGYGKTVIMRHKGFETLYAHCNSILVNHGDWIEQGSAIGTVGSTGRATGPHLHFEIRRSGKPLNPIAWLGDPPPNT